MSIKYLNAAFESQVGDSTQKFVLVALADYCDEDGIAYPALTTLAERTNLSRRSVISVIKKLIEKGFISKISNEAIPGRYKKTSNQNCYQVHLDILVKQSNRLRKVTSEEASPELVKQGNQQLVKQLHINHHIKPSINHQLKTVTKSSGSEIPFEDIVGYLNEKAGTGFRSGSETTRRLVSTRWGEGYRLEDFRIVVDNQVSQWRSDPDMCQFLRPSTLFGPKFESYRHTAKPKEKSRWE